MADRDRGDDGVVRCGTNARADRGWRDHGCAGEFVVCVECVGGDVGARGAGGAVPAEGEAGYKIGAVGWVSVSVTHLFSSRWDRPWWVTPSGLRFAQPRG